MLLRNQLPALHRLGPLIFCLRQTKFAGPALGSRRGSVPLSRPCPLVPVCRAGRHPPNQCALPGTRRRDRCMGFAAPPFLHHPSQKKAHHPGRKWWAMLTQRSRRRIAVRGKRTGILPNPVVRCGPLAAIDRCGFCCSQADPQAAGRRRPLGWLPESLGILQFSCGTV